MTVATATARALKLRDQVDGTFEPPPNDVPLFDYEKTLASIDDATSRRQAWTGVAVLGATVIALLVAVKWLARWLALG